MAVVVTTPEDVLNIAFGRIGYKNRIGSIFEGSMAAKQALDIYSQTRDEMLRAVDYGFAERNVQMTLLKQAPVGGYFPPVVWDGTVNPPVPWVFSYSYPGDCLKVRAIKPIPMFVMDFDPQPNVFTIENDQYFVPAQKVILCNVPQAMLVYTGQVTDPATWETDFTEAFCAELARRLAPVLANLEAAKFAAADAAQATATAEVTEG